MYVVCALYVRDNTLMHEVWYHTEHHQCSICYKSRHHSDGINSDIALEMYPYIAPRGLFMNAYSHPYPYLARKLINYVTNPLFQFIKQIYRDSWHNMTGHNTTQVFMTIRLWPNIWGNSYILGRVLMDLPLYWLILCQSQFYIHRDGVNYISRGYHTKGSQGIKCCRFAAVCPFILYWAFYAARAQKHKRMIDLIDTITKCTTQYTPYGDIAV